MKNAREIWFSVLQLESGAGATFLQEGNNFRAVLFRETVAVGEGVDGVTGTSLCVKKIKRDFRQPVARE